MAVAASSTGGLRLPDPALSSTNPGNAHLHRVEMTCPPSWSPPPGAQPPAPRAFPWVPLRVSRVRWGHRTGCPRSALAATPALGGPSPPFGGQHSPGAPDGALTLQLQSPAGQSPVLTASSRDEVRADWAVNLCGE